MFYDVLVLWRPVKRTAVTILPVVSLRQDTAISGTLVGDGYYSNLSCFVLLVYLSPIRTVVYICLMCGMAFLPVRDCACAARHKNEPTQSPVFL